MSEQDKLPIDPREDGSAVEETPAAQEVPAATDAPQVTTSPAASPADADSAATRNEAADSAVLEESRKHTRRSFVGATAAAVAGYGFYRWIDQSPGAEMQPAPLRRAFLANAAIAQALSRDHALAPTYAPEEAKDLRVNGVYGLKKMLAPESWRLQLVGVRNAAHHPRFTNDVTAWEYRYETVINGESQGHDTKVDPNARTAAKMAPESMLSLAGQAEESTGRRMPRGQEEAGESRSTLMPGTPGLLLTMQDILALPRHELVTQFKCIEGWSEIVHWAAFAWPISSTPIRPTLLTARSQSTSTWRHRTAITTPATISAIAAIRRRCSSRK